MKNLAIIVFLSCMIAVIHSAVVRQWPPEMEAALDKCSKERDINKVQAQLILSHREPATNENEKCLMSCYMEARGFLVDHKVDWEGVYQSHAARIPDPKLKEKMKKVFEKCEANFSYEGKNDCQIAYDAYNCA